MSSYAQRTKAYAFATLLAIAVAFGFAVAPQGYAQAAGGDLGPAAADLSGQDAVTVDTVKAAIGGLSNDPRTFTAADIDRVMAIEADYESLSDEDQATIDSTFNHPSGDGQSYGRVLEAAVWAVSSFDTDTSTTLADATYTTTDEPMVSSKSDKGKSDSSRTRNWWVESVQVQGGQATAKIYVTSGDATANKLTTYPSVWIAGQTVNRDEADNTYTIPVDLNGATYFGGISSSMPRPIMYSLETTIAEPIEIAVTNNVDMFSPADTATLECMGVPGTDGYSAKLILPMKSASLSEAFVGTPSEAAETSGTIVFDGESNTFTIPVTDFTDGEPFTISFKSARNGNWYGRTATLDEEAGTLVFDPWIDPAPANTVDEMIAKIQSQVFTDTTWADCEAAKAAWDALSDAEKALVEEYDYFGLDTGDASADDPLNQDGIGENEILVVSFGTSFNESRAATIGGVEKALQTAYPDWSVRRAFTAQIIINHVYARDGKKIDNVKQAMDRAVANGVKNMVVQPTHLMHGAEYDELKAEIDTYADQINIVYAEPLLGSVGADATEINDDKLAVAEHVVAAAAADAGYSDAAAAAADGAAIVLMGHGTAHSAAITYEQMQTAMGKLGYANVFVGTVEGEPESTECSNVIAAVKAAGYTKVILRPLMVVAGDHANNDMADPEDEESWFSQFTAEDNFESENVTCQIAGLGQIPAIQQIYVAHTAEAVTALNSVDLAVTNNTGMFKAVTASAVENEDGSSTLTFALSGTGYHWLFKGTYEQAVAANEAISAGIAAGEGSDKLIKGYTNADGKWEFQIQITADELGKNVPVVAVSQSYYDKYVDGQNALERAFYPRQLNLDLEAKTLITDDYAFSQSITVTNNVRMFKPDDTATLNTVGGPNSNNYKSDLVLPMQSDTMTNAFVGIYAEAIAADSTIELAEGNTFTIPVKWVESFGDPTTLVSLCNGEQFAICFKSSKGWYERLAKLDEAAGTLVFDPSEADYTAVNEQKSAAAAVDRSLYSTESLAALDAAVEAVVEGKFKSQQAEVDAMAQAIKDSIDGLLTPAQQAEKDLGEANDAVQLANTKVAEAQTAAQEAANAVAKAEKSGSAEDAAAAVAAAGKATQAAEEAELAAKAAALAANKAKASAKETGDNEAITAADTVAANASTAVANATAAKNEAATVAGNAEKAAAAAAAPKANPMKASAKAVKVKAKKVKKKAQTVNAITVTGAQGKLTYKIGKISTKKKLAKQAKKKIKVLANGKIKLGKKLKKGTYKVTVAVTDAGNASYKAATQNVTVKIKVK